MANAKDSFTNAAPVLASAAVGAAAGHFAGRGKNLILGAVLLLGADVIASKVPVKAISATNLRVAGVAAMVVAPAAPSSSSQTLAQYAKDGLNRVKGAANGLVMGAGVSKGPFTLASASIPAIPVEVSGYDSYGSIGEGPYDYGTEEPAAYLNQGYAGAEMGAIDPSQAGR